MTENLMETIYKGVGRIIEKQQDITGEGGPIELEAFSRGMQSRKFHSALAFFFTVLGFELRVYTLSHSTSPF
jgi:hypothetical protein